jgi:outer membrane protein OmpA-like peptidoglycan-associated protein
MMTILKIFYLSLCLIYGCNTVQHQHLSHMNLQNDHLASPLKTTTSNTDVTKNSSKTMVAAQRIAILPLKNQAHQKVSLAKINYLTDHMRILMTHLPHRLFSIMTQENFTVMLDPEEGGLEDCVGECEIKIGKLLNAHWLITGELLDLGNTLTITLKLHHTQSGQFIAGTSFQAQDFESLVYALKQNIIGFLPTIYPQFPEGRLQLISRYLASKKDQLIQESKSSRKQKQLNQATLPCTSLVQKSNYNNHSPCVSSSSALSASTSTSSHTHTPQPPPSIYFSNRQTKILRKSLNSLHQVFTLLKADPHLRIQIRGHTDDRERKTRQQRLVLSKKRSKIVFNYLLLQGINASRLEVKGLGSSQPLSSHQSLKARIRNRRVDFSIL